MNAFEKMMTDVKFLLPNWSWIAIALVVAAVIIIVACTVALNRRKNKLNKSSEQEIDQTFTPPAKSETDFENSDSDGFERLIEPFYPVPENEQVAEGVIQADEPLETERIYADANNENTQTLSVETAEVKTRPEPDDSPAEEVEYRAEQVGRQQRFDEVIYSPVVTPVTESAQDKPAEKTVKKTSAKKTAASKTTAKKSTAKKTATKSAASKSTAKKPAAKKAAKPVEVKQEVKAESVENTAVLTPVQEVQPAPVAEQKVPVKKAAKTTAKKPTAKKAATKSAASKSTSKKPAAKKAAKPVEVKQEVKAESVENTEVVTPVSEVQPAPVAEQKAPAKKTAKTTAKKPTAKKAATAPVPAEEKPAAKPRTVKLRPANDDGGVPKVSDVLSDPIPEPVRTEPEVKPVKSRAKTAALLKDEPTETQSERQPEPVAAKPAAVKDKKQTPAAKKVAKPAAKPAAVKQAKPAKTTKPVKVNIKPANVAVGEEKVYHVTKRATDNKWEVRIEGSAKAIKLFRTKAEAMDFAIPLAGDDNDNVRVVIHRADGRPKNIAFH